MVAEMVGGCLSSSERLNVLEDHQSAFTQELSLLVCLHYTTTARLTSISWICLDLNGGVKLWRDADKLNLDGDIDILIVVVAIFKHMSHAKMGDFGIFRIYHFVLFIVQL